MWDVWLPGIRYCDVPSSVISNIAKVFRTARYKGDTSILLSESHFQIDLEIVRDLPSFSSIFLDTINSKDDTCYVCILLHFILTHFICPF